MPKTTPNLYRRGNVSSPRMTQVRIGKDIVTFQINGIDWVVARSGGVSTFSVQGPGKNWWLLPAGFDYPDELLVVNDHGNHHDWEPNVHLPLAEYRFVGDGGTRLPQSQLVRRTMMKLSLKAIRFVIEALEHYQKNHDQLLTDEGLSEDDASDLVNDRHYLEAIQKDFEKYRDELLEQRANVKADA